MEKILLLSIALTFFVSVSAWSRETHLMITNFSKNKIITTIVAEIDSFDFEKGNGPQDKFQNVQIPSGSSEERHIEVNQLASECPFTMTLWFDDGTSDWFRINQKYALRSASAGFKSSKGHKIEYSRSGNTIVISVKDK